MTLLDVQHLSVSFNSEDGVVKAVRDLSFDLEPSRTLAIVGESGSGKSVATQSITGLTRGAAVTGEVRFEGVDLLSADIDTLRRLRGPEIGMIFQDPLSSLHPYYKIGWQVVELIREHDKRISRRAARARAAELLTLVGIPRAAERIDDFPHQFSGGMRQRVMIAMAMALEPALLIADEPTTALDVTVQAQVLGVMRDLQERFGTAIILITHDLGVVADLADEVIVMYAGTVMERASRRDLFYRHHHPYTEGLLASLPGQRVRGDRLDPIPGTPPSMIDVPTGCPFAPRCPYVFERCRESTPPLAPVYDDANHHSACWLSADLQTRRALRDELVSRTRTRS
jgi:peptide/nickel transport system ATP-binding protein